MIKNTYTTTIKEKNSKSKYPKSKSKKEKKVKKGKITNSIEEFFYSDKW